MVVLRYHFYFWFLILERFILELNGNVSSPGVPGFGVLSTGLWFSGPEYQVLESSVFILDYAVAEWYWWVPVMKYSWWFLAHLQYLQK